MSTTENTARQAGIPSGTFDVEETSVTELQSLLERGLLTSKKLVEIYIERIRIIDGKTPKLNSVIELNPDALQIAARMDRERSETGPRTRLHGIPVLLKDNIATTDKMETTAGSLALVGSRPKREAFVAIKLREAGAVILGKTNLSEWANFRSSSSSSGWSARGGQVKNPYVLDRSPCGSSSGSAVAVAANLAPVAVGTETDGSILCPASSNCLVGIKPTLGLVSRDGVVPIAHSQDTVGPMTRTVADAAILLGVLAGYDANDSSMAKDGGYHDDYTRFLDPDALRGARIGVAREAYFGNSPKADRVAEEAIAKMREMGAVIIDPANIPGAKKMADSESEMTVLLYEFKQDLNRYLSELETSQVRSLKDVLEFNRSHAGTELAYFGQELFEKAEGTTGLDDPKYLNALEENHRLSKQEGIDRVMDEHRLDALVAPTWSPAGTIDLIVGDHRLGGSSQPTALSGYPAVTVPAGFVFDLPVGITFIGRAFSEPTLIKLAYAFEQATRVRAPPRFLPSVP